MHPSNEQIFACYSLMNHWEIACKFIYVNAQTTEKLTFMIIYA